MENTIKIMKRLHVLEYLSANPKQFTLLFVHGAWHGAWCWEEFFLPYFQSKGFSSLALDLRSHGKSQSKGFFKLLSLNDYVQDVHEVVQEIGKNSRIILIGHSMGGMVVQKYLAKYPNFISSAILLTPATTWGVRSITFNVMVHHPILYLKMNLFFTLRPLVSNLKLFKKYFFYSTTDEKKIIHYQSLTQDEAYRAYINMLLHRIKYKNISLPVLVLTGDKDQIFKVKHQTKLLSKIKGSTLEIFENTGHDMMLEQNWIKQAETIETWINSTSKKSK